MVRSIASVLWHSENNADIANQAPYIRQQRKERLEAEAPVQDEVEERLPPLSTGAGSTIRIPPELMPSDDEAMNYFKIYFNDIHPYVPVVHRSRLYYQWQNERSSISPLLLEALFACAGRLSDDPAQGAQWLALANSKLVPLYALRGAQTVSNQCSCNARTRVQFHGCTTTKHDSSIAFAIESSRVSAKKGLLLSFMANCEDNCLDVEGFRHP